MSPHDLYAREPRDSMTHDSMREGCRVWFVWFRWVYLCGLGFDVWGLP